MGAIRSVGSMAKKGEKNTTPRVNKATATARVNQIYQWISECKTRPEIIEMGGAQWGVGRGQIDNYIKQAREQITKDWTIDRKEYVTQLSQKLEYVARKSLESNQNSNAIGAYGLQARILGIDGKS